MSGMVGTFETYFPVVIPVEETIEDQVVAVKECIRGTPGGGAEFGLLSELSSDEGLRKVLRTAPSIRFTFLGRAEQLFSGTSFAIESGPSSESALRDEPIDITAAVIEGKLELRLTHTPRFDPSFVETLARDLRRSLVEVIRYCTRPGVGRFTPSDFALVSSQSTEAVTRAYPTLTDIWPLSPPQLGMLIHALIEPAMFVRVSRATVRSSFDMARLSEALDQVVARHDALRVALTRQGEAPHVQALLAEARAPLDVRDLRGRGASDVQLELRRIAEESRTRGFELDRAPLMRVTAARLHDGAWELQLTTHGLVADRASAQLLLQEICTAYAGEPLDQDAPSFREHLEWLRDHPETDDEALAWRRAFDSHAPRRLFSAPRFGGALVERQVRRVEGVSLTRAARRKRVTVDTLVHTAFAVALARITGESDVMWGAHFDTRAPQSPLREGAVGALSGVLPARARVSGSSARTLADVDDVLTSLLARPWQALAHVQRWLHSPPGRPLFDVVVDVVEGDAPALPTSSATPYPIHVTAFVSDGCALDASYDPTPATSEAVAELLGAVEDALRVVTTAADVPISVPRARETTASVGRRIASAGRATAREPRRGHLGDRA